MRSVLQATLGAPGIYHDPVPPIRELAGVRMDVAAFAGVAPRGPAREPVLDPHTRALVPDRRVMRPWRRSVPVMVESFDEYRRWFGGFEGPGLLPYAVSVFFENGGRRACVVRIVHDYGSAAGNAGRVAWGTLGGAVSSAGPLRVRARNEGAWGNRLRTRLTFRSRPLNPLRWTASEVVFPDDGAVVPGSLLQIRAAAGTRVYRFVDAVRRERRERSTVPVLVARLSDGLPPGAVDVALVDGDLLVEDGEREERHTGQGLSPEHPRWLAATLAHDSALLFPGEDWSTARLEPADVPGVPFAGGEDRYEDLVPEDFLDPTWTPGDDEPGDGVTALSGVGEVSLLLAPDLYSPQPLAERVVAEEPGTAGSPEFVRCEVRPPGPAPEIPVEPDLAGLRLDPAQPADREEILRLQQAVVEFAESQRRMVVLLDVPPRLGERQILAWRGAFDSAYAAAYHPWVRVAPPEDARDALIAVPPSAFAAGIIAARERQFGLPHGPANELAKAAVDVERALGTAEHGRLHAEGINVFLRERDGIRLSAARTLSRDTTWRQLSVRRLVTMIRLTLERRMQWVVFEPNHRALRTELQRMLTLFLRRLFQAGAFAGATEADSFFVRCDDSLNPAPSVDAGRLVTHIGVAPAEPVEFIVLRLVREGDGTLLLED